MTINNITYIVIRTTEYTHNGEVRQSIILRKPNGKRTYNVIRYSNGALSSVV